MGGELPISAAEIYWYAKMHGFLDDIEFFYRVMTECDAENLKFNQESREQKEQNRSASRPSGSSPRPRRPRKGRRR